MAYVIRSFRHKGLERFWASGDIRGIAAQHAARLLRMLDALHASKNPPDLNLPGFGWHPLKGAQRGRFALKVSGNWRLTFGFQRGDAINLDLEDYH